MVSQRITIELQAALARLSESQQERVVEFARTLGSNGTRPHGIAIGELMQFAGTVAPEDLQEIQAIIDRDCEQVDPNGW